MTKFAYCSDLHLGFGCFVLDNTDNADCLILAGDIIEIEDLNSSLQFNVYTEFFKNVSKEFKTVIWVPGNHEFYSSLKLSIDELMERGQSFLTDLGLTNVHLVNNQTVVVDGIPVHCGTMWTNLNKNNPIAVRTVERGMNDFVYIFNDNKVHFRAYDWIQRHQDTIAFLTDTIKEVPCVVVTHHQPHPMGCASSNSLDQLNYGYASDLSEFILDRPQIEYWVAGHTHVKRMYNIGETQVLTNCRGYQGHDPSTARFKLEHFTL